MPALLAALHRLVAMAALTSLGGCLALFIKNMYEMQTMRHDEASNALYTSAA